MAAFFESPDLSNIYISPAQGLPFFLVVQVSERRYAVAQFSTNNVGVEYATEYVLVTKPMSHRDAHSRAQFLRIEKMNAISARS